MKEDTKIDISPTTDAKKDETHERLTSLRDILDEHSDSESKDNPYRKEMPWNSKNECLLISWKDEMVIKANIHGKKALSNRLLYRILSVPTIIIPITLTTFNDILIEYKHIQGILLTLLGILSGILTLLNLGSKYQLHFEYQNSYNNLEKKIDLELAKNRKHRTQADVYLEHIMGEYNKLDERAPNI